MSYFLPGRGGGEEAGVSPLPSGIMAQRSILRIVCIDRPRGRHGYAPPRGPIFFIFMQFSQKNHQTISWHPHLWRCPPICEILDAPLVCTAFIYMNHGYKTNCRTKPKFFDIMGSALLYFIWWNYLVNAAFMSSGRESISPVPLFRLIY